MTSCSIDSGRSRALARWGACARRAGSRRHPHRRRSPWSSWGRSSAATGWTRIGQVHADRAQLLVTTALTVGPERAAIAAARAVADEPDAATPLVAHLQPAAFDAELRLPISTAGLSLDDLHAETAAAAGIEVPDLQKVHRVSWGSLLRLVLLGAVAYALISQIADIGWDTITEALRSASLPILLVALVLGQTPPRGAGRVAADGITGGRAPDPGHEGRCSRVCFINIAVPSTAARAATSIRFFQRSGATPAGAVSAGALDSVFGFIAQITLLLTFLLLGLGTLGFGGESSLEVDEATLQTVVAIVVGLVIAAIVAVVVVAPLRRWLAKIVGQLKDALAVLHSPGAVVRLLGYNLIAELLFSLTIWTVLRAFGQDVDYVDVVIINETRGPLRRPHPCPRWGRCHRSGAHRRVHRRRRTRRHRLFGCAVLPTVHLLPASDLGIRVHELAPTRGLPVSGDR